MAIQLTRDELITFLAIIGIPTMNGLDDEPLAGLDEREIAERLNSGEQSLIHRGLLELNEQGQAVLDDTLVALVGGSAVPDATLLLTQVNPDGTNDPHYFNATPELLIEHYSPRVGIHQFDYLPDLETLTTRVQTLLAPLETRDGVVDGVNMQINSAALAKFIEAAQNKAQDAARATLAEEGVADSIAEMLAADYTTHPSWVGVSAWNLRSQTPSGGQTVMIISSDNHLWLLENIAGQSDQVRVRQASGGDCIRALAALSAPINQVYQPSNSSDS